ncbi:MAG: EAL domain-containing protein [Vulcanococcus sp.]
MRLLRSWLKQERTALAQRRWRNTLLIGGGMVSLVLILEGIRRINSVWAEALTRQTHNLELLDWQVRDSRRTSQDWAHWDESLAFVKGQNPGFPAKDMATTALISDGGVMAIFGENGSRLAMAGGVAGDRRTSSGLSHCLQEVDQKRRALAVSHLGVLCRGEQTLYVGTIEAISDNNAEVVSQASLAYLLPLLNGDRQTPLGQSLLQLQSELLLAPPTPSEPPAQRQLSPALWTSGGHPVRLLEPSDQAGLQQEMIALLGLSFGAGVLILGLRMQWMLVQRRAQLADRRGVRLFNQRLRRSERQLEHLLDRMQEESSDAARGVFARLLDRKLADRLDPDTPRQEKLAERVEQVLEAAQSLLLLDNLTGLPNRNFFLERLHWQSEQNRSKREPLALLFINIDKFKQINETYGHRVGDEVIRHVAQELKQLVGEEIFLARFGGDEFSLILNTSTLATHDEASIRDHAQAKALELLEGYHRNARRSSGEPGINLSIGIALSDPEGTSAEELVRRSDMAMSLAKAGRHDRISIFDISKDINSLNDYRLYDALQFDIKHHQDHLKVLFQPIVSSTGSLHKLEALSRWNNPNFSEVGPEIFFGVAERYRIIGELGQLILEKTLREFTGLRNDLQQPDLQLALNISPSQLSQDQFADKLLAQLQRHVLNPQSITIEITESAVVEASYEFSNNLQQLRAAGMRLALDDFGTGFSSLRLLMWLKPDELKIDKSFVLAASGDPVARQIVELLRNLAEQMQLTLVAEGVEEQAVFDLLRKIGLDRFQGHLFWRAQSAEELLRALPSQPAALAP